MYLNKAVRILLIVLFLVGILGAGGLVLKELQTGNGCPKIGSVPVCIVVLICFVVPFFAHLKRKWNKLYFFFTGIALLIAIVASTMQFTGNGECPKTSDGLPMCYLSFLIFSVLIVLKLVLLKNQTKQTEQHL